MKLTIAHIVMSRIIAELQRLTDLSHSLDADDTFDGEVGLIRCCELIGGESECNGEFRA